MADLSEQLNTLAELSVSMTGPLTSVIEPSSDNFEGDIPQLSELPTLDSILDEDDETHPTIDELGLSDVLTGEDGSTDDVTTTPSAAITDGSLRASFSLDPNFSLDNKGSQKSCESSILRQDLLKGIANQLTKPNIRSAAGYPTAMVVGKYFMIGTSHGLILWFDANERLVNVLTPKQGKPYEVGQYGAVSAVDISADGTRLLVGHAKGLITHWDLENQKLLRFIDDAHPPGYAVLNIRFTDDPTVCLFNDTGGNVYFLKFRRNFTGVRTWSSECFFSGCNGEAFTFEPVKIGKISNHPLKEHCIIAIATVTQLIVLSVAPKLEGLVSMPLPGKAKALPLLAWEFAIVEDVDKERSKSAVYPILATVREDIIHYLQLTCTDSTPSFKLLKKVKVNYHVAAFRWINSHLVVAMDTTERIHLISIRENVEIEVLDLKQVELVYGTSFYKSIETGGNVSRALEVASEHACYNSVVSRKNQLLLLGMNSIHVITIKTWKERLASLVRDGQFVQAINLGVELYEGKARAAIGLPSSPKKKREVIMEQVIDTLLAFVDIKLIVNKPTITGEAELRLYYKKICKVAFDSCVRVRNFNILFGSIYETFCGEGELTRSVYLEMLFDYVTDSKIYTVKASVAKDLIDYFHKKGNKKDLEQCILGLNPLYMDMQHIIGMCWSEHLYDAMIHVYNNGMLDYTTPLVELLLQLRAAIKKKKKALPDHFQKIGHALLVYIRCCATGLAYPTGNIPDNKVLLAKTSIYETLLTRQNSHDPSDKQFYPHIRTLLEFDTREFLNVLSFAFEERDFDRVQAGEELPGIPTRQLIVDILLQVILRDKLTHFSPSQVGSLFTFLARQGAKHHESIRVDSDIYDQVLTYFTKTDEDVANEERQQAVLELWDCGVLKKFDEERLLVMADSARFYRLCELLYDKRRQYAKVLMCYFKDPQRINHSFSYIRRIMTEDQFSEADREECTTAVMNNVETLLRTNVHATAELILVDFPLELAEVTYKLDDKREMQFEFLKRIFDPKTSSKQEEVQAPSHVAEKFIELLCEYQPQSVYSFLKKNENYRLEEALDICTMAKLLDATAYLLERAGDVKGAFKLTLDALEKKLIEFGNKYRTAIGVSTEFSDDLTGVNNVLLVLLDLCQRNSVRVDEKSRQLLWLPAFDLVLSMPNKYKGSSNKDLLEAFKTLIADVLDSMMGYISLPDVLLKIIEDPSYESGNFNDIKPIVTSMLDTYNYEEVLLKTTNNIFMHDVQNSLSNLYVLSHKAVATVNDTCCLCDRVVSYESVGISTAVDDVILFNCGHVYHCSCMGVSGPSMVGLTCSLCDKSTKPSTNHQTRLTGQQQKHDTDPKLSQLGKKQNKDDSLKLDHSQIQRLKLLNRAVSNQRTEYQASPYNNALRLAPPRLEGANL